MNTKNTTMLVVSLIVGVVLITGVVTPIISNAINDGSDSSAQGMRYAHNPTPYKYVDVIQMYEDGVISNDGITTSEVEEYLYAGVEMPTSLITVIVQWAGDENPTYLVGGQFYATDGTNTAVELYMTDLDLENRTCMYNVDTTGEGSPSSVSKTFTSLKLLLGGFFDPGSAWETYYAQSTEGMYYNEDIELANQDGITTIGVATTGGSNDTLATLDAFAVDESLIYPVEGTVSRTMSFSNHILNVSYAYTSGGSSGVMDDIFIIAPTTVQQYETEDGMISGDNECIGRYVDGRAYMSVMYRDENASTIPLAGGENGLYTFDSGIPSTITSIVTDGEYTDYYWEYSLPYLDGIPCVGGGVSIAIPSGGYSAKLYMEDIDWNAQTCTLYSRADIGFPNSHFDSVQVLMKESDIGKAVDPVSAMELYNSATMGFYRTGMDVRLNSLEDATVIGQQVEEGTTNWLAWAINDEVMYPQSGSTLVYTPAYTNHILTGAEFALTVSGSAVDVMTIGMIAPVSFEYEAGGSGGSGGLSPTLTAILSIVPLLMTVGLVIAAVGYLRMKN